MSPNNPETPAETFATYLEGLFDENDSIYLQLIHSTNSHIGKDGKPAADTKLVPLMEMRQAVMAATYDRLKELESEGWNVYVCMNPFPTGTQARRERFVETVRNVYI